MEIRNWQRLLRSLLLASALFCWINPSCAQDAKTSGAVRQTHSADAQLCKGKMSCYTSEMRKAAAIRNADRKAKAQIQAKNKGNTPTTQQQEVKQ
jgi:hypothetical protein